MTKTAAIAVVVLLCLTALSARGARQSDNLAKSNGTHVERRPKKTIRISGTVGADGKTLVSDGDKRIWTVANPDSLKLSEGCRVSVKAHANRDSSEIDVITVRLKDERLKAKVDDSAFRR